MIHPYQTQQTFKTVIELYQAMETDLVVSIAKYFKGGEPTDAYRWRLNKLEQLGGVRQDTIKIISQYSGKVPQEIERAFNLVAVQTLESDEQVFKMALRKGLLKAAPVPIGASPMIEQILQATITNAKAITNLTNTTALTASMAAYTDVVNQVYLETMTGVSNYRTAVGKAVNTLADKGIRTVMYAGGVRTGVDVAVRRNILTSSAQMVGKLQIQRAQEYGANLVEVSAHMDARPTHAVWQGKIYSIYGSTPEYPNLAEATGYGTGEGLMGWNCRHVFYPYFAGLSKQVYEGYNLDKVEQAYENSQIQRSMEREVRKWTRREMAAQEMGDELGAAKARAKIKEKRADYEAFSKRTNRTPRRERMIVYR